MRGLYDQDLRYVRAEEKGAEFCPFPAEEVYHGI